MQGRECRPFWIRGNPTGIINQHKKIKRFMKYTERFRKVAVMGAAGKMGSGILLLTAMEMTDLQLEDKSLEMELLAVDVSRSGLKGLMGYIESQARRAAEKKTVLLRKLYSDRDDLIENGEIIEAYVSDVLSMIQTTTHLEDAYGASLVFEAIKEDPQLKVSILGQISESGNGDTWFFTNTSSIPIGELDDFAGLRGSIIGFHFYNPPAVQKLVELIPAEFTRQELKDFAVEYARRLRKVVVPSSDFAGFIGNGHFMRDALYGIRQAEELSDKYSLPESIYLINHITQTWLIRPMGIFQLIDYVGVDVVSYIMKVMDPYLPDEELHSSLLDRFIDKGILGGQFPDGSQKDGILKYERGRPVAVFDIASGSYADIGRFKDKVEADLGSPPEKLRWRDVNFSPDKKAILEDYFGRLKQSGSPGAQMAVDYGKESARIANLLVSSGVASTTDDVNKVLETGFYHAYGPVSNYF
jgi:3-hydroxyacyl-CoA dehydrogenase